LVFLIENRAFDWNFSGKNQNRIERSLDAEAENGIDKDVIEEALRV